MSLNPEKPIPSRENKTAMRTVKMSLYVLGSLLLFLFSVDLMVSSLQHLGHNAADMIILATSNPFTGLFIGLLVTAMIQSSSATTSMVVALVASGSITLESAIPIIMGANIGTTITSTIVSLGFINKRKEFKRAVAAGTYHDFFNILTVIILFPLEYYYGFLSTIASALTSYFFDTSTVSSTVTSTHLWKGVDPLIEWLLKLVPSGFILLGTSIVLLFTSILLFRKLISSWMLEKSPENLSRFFFKNRFKSFSWGLIITAAIRSSTITTSLVVPLVAKRVVKLNQAAPFILGANIGTTITAFIAALLYTTNSSAITIAIAHFLFNAIGVILFLPIPALSKIPLDLANYLGKLTLRYRLAGFVYLLSTFFFIPFSLIYLNRDAVDTISVVYNQQLDGKDTGVTHRMVAKMNQTTNSGEWIEYSSVEDSESDNPVKIYPIHIRNNVLFYKKEMFMFSKPGFCWDGENEKGKYHICIDSVFSKYTLGEGSVVDSVFKYVQHYEHDASSSATTIYVSPLVPLILRKENRDSLGVRESIYVSTLKKD